jgi:hypothetical protein
MGINANTKISDLLKQYPFLEDFLVILSPKFKGLKKPIMRKTIGKVAGIGGSDLDDFLAALTKEIERQVGKPSAAVESTPAGAGSASPHPEKNKQPKAKTGCWTGNRRTIARRIMIAGAAGRRSGTVWIWKLRAIRQPGACYRPPFVKRTAPPAHQSSMPADDG